MNSWLAMIVQYPDFTDANILVKPHMCDGAFTMMIYTHVLNKGGKAVVSPLDR